MIKPLSIALVGLVLVAGAAAKPANRSAAAAPAADRKAPARGGPQASGSLPVQLSSSAIFFYDCGAFRGPWEDREGGNLGCSSAAPTYVAAPAGHGC
jgi:hypothetical protein